MGPGDQNDVGRVRSILHFVNSNDIGARLLKLQNATGAQKKIDSDVHCPNFEHSILEWS